MWRRTVPQFRAVVGRECGGVRPVVPVLARLDPELCPVDDRRSRPRVRGSCSRSRRRPDAGDDRRRADGDTNDDGDADGVPQQRASRPLARLYRPSLGRSSLEAVGFSRRLWSVRWSLFVALFASLALFLVAVACSVPRGCRLLVRSCGEKWALPDSNYGHSAHCVRSVPFFESGVGLTLLVTPLASLATHSLLSWPCRIRTQSLPAVVPCPNLAERRDSNHGHAARFARFVPWFESGVGPTLLVTPLASLATHSLLSWPCRIRTTVGMSRVLYQTKLRALHSPEHGRD